MCPFGCWKNNSNTLSESSPQNWPANRIVAAGAAELTESLGPQALDDIPVGH